MATSCILRVINHKIKNKAMNKETYIAPSIEVVSVETESMIATSTYYIHMSNSPTNSDASMANGFRGDWFDFD